MVRARGRERGPAPAGRRRLRSGRVSGGR